MYKDQIRYIEALAQYKKAVALDDQNALYLDRLASMHHDMGQYLPAEPLFKESLAIGKKQLGDEHPNVATSLNNLEMLYDTQGRYEKADPLHLQAITTFENSLGGEHPNTQMVKRNYANSKAKMADNNSNE